MLFDHGCDAINSVITAFSQAGCFGLGWLGGWSYIATCVYLAFFFQTWEEYYVGEMILPIFNGPSEGLLMSAALALFSGLHPDGPNMWQKEVDLSSLYIHAPNVFENFGIVDGSSTIKLGSMVVIFLLIWTWITVISQIFNVTRVAEKNHHSVVKALADTLPFWVFSSATFMWFRNTELFQVIGSAPNVNVENSNLLMVAMLLLGSIMVDMVTHLMLSHICHSPIRSYKRYFAFLIAVLPALACIQKDQLNDGTKFGPFVKDMDLERKFLYVITTLSTIYTCNNLYQVSKLFPSCIYIYILIFFSSQYFIYNL
jgi:ethanolaminephosphotransferase